MSTLLPEPTGDYDTATTVMKLVDTTRPDPFAPLLQSRAIMISIFYPVSSSQACHPSRIIDYMPPATATFEDQYYGSFGVPNGTFESLKLRVCREGAPVSSAYPLVLFSPGAGTSRLLYTALAQTLASTGFIVITIDHPYDANIVEFPSGDLVLGTIDFSSEANIELALNTRSQDASFVLDQLSHPSVARRLLPGVSRGLDVRHVAMYGHSLGGAAAAATIQGDNRVVGGLDMDGSFFGNITNAGFTCPFLLFGRQNHTRFTDASWGDIWPHLLGWKRELKLAGSQHLTFSDAPLLVKALNLTDRLSSDLVGTLDGARALEIVSAYVIAFMNLVLKGIKVTLLDHQVPDFPEVSFVV